MSALDDALAHKLGFEEGMGKLREVVVGQMQREYDGLSRLRLKRELLDALSERAHFAAPSSMVEGEFASIWARVEADLKAGRGDAEDQGRDEDALRSEYRGIAERRVRLGLLLSEIGRTAGVVVAPDEMTRAMRAEAGRYPGQEAQVMEFFRKNPQATESLRGPIFEDKVVDYILELARVEERVVTPEELGRDPEAASTEEAAVPVEAAAEPQDAAPAAATAEPEAQPEPALAAQPDSEPAAEHHPVEEPDAGHEAVPEAHHAAAEHATPEPQAELHPAPEHDAAGHPDTPPQS